MANQVFPPTAQLCYSRDVHGVHSFPWYSIRRPVLKVRMREQKLGTCLFGREKVGYEKGSDDDNDDFVLHHHHTNPTHWYKGKCVDFYMLVHIFGWNIGGIRVISNFRI